MQINRPKGNLSAATDYVTVQQFAAYQSQVNSTFGTKVSTADLRVYTDGITAFGQGTLTNPITASGSGGGGGGDSYWTQNSTTLTNSSPIQKIVLDGQIVERKNNVQIDWTNGTVQIPTAADVKAYVQGLPTTETKTDGRTIKGSGVTSDPIALMHVFTDSTLSGGGTESNPLHVVSSGSGGDSFWYMPDTNTLQNVEGAGFIVLDAGVVSRTNQRTVIWNDATYEGWLPTVKDVKTYVAAAGTSRTDGLTLKGAGTEADPFAIRRIYCDGETCTGYGTVASPVTVIGGGGSGTDEYWVITGPATARVLKPIDDLSGFSVSVDGNISLSGGNSSILQLNAAKITLSNGVSVNWLNEGDETRIPTVGDIKVELKDKVDKVEGKALSSNDFDDKYKAFIDDFVFPDPTTVGGWVINTVGNKTVLSTITGIDDILMAASAGSSLTIDAKYVSRKNATAIVWDLEDDNVKIPSVSDVKSYVLSESTQSVWTQVNGKLTPAVQPSSFELKTSTEGSIYVNTAGVAIYDKTTAGFVVNAGKVRAVNPVTLSWITDTDCYPTIADVNSWYITKTKWLITNDNLYNPDTVGTVTMKASGAGWASQVTLYENKANVTSAQVILSGTESITLSSAIIKASGNAAIDWSGTTYDDRLVTVKDVKANVRAGLWSSDAQGRLAPVNPETVKTIDIRTYDSQNRYLGLSANAGTVQLFGSEVDWEDTAQNYRIPTVKDIYNFPMSEGWKRFTGGIVNNWSNGPVNIADFWVTKKQSLKITFQWEGLGDELEGGVAYVDILVDDLRTDETFYSPSLSMYNSTLNKTVIYTARFSVSIDAEDEEETIQFRGYSKGVLIDDAYTNWNSRETTGFKAIHTSDGAGLGTAGGGGGGDSLWWTDLAGILRPVTKPDKFIVETLDYMELNAGSNLFLRVADRINLATTTGDLIANVKKGISLESLEDTKVRAGGNIDIGQDEDQKVLFKQQVGTGQSNREIELRSDAINLNSKFVYKSADVTVPISEGGPEIPTAEDIKNAMTSKQTTAGTMYPDSPDFMQWVMKKDGTLDPVEYLVDPIIPVRNLTWSTTVWQIDVFYNSRGLVQMDVTLIAEPYKAAQLPAYVLPAELRPQYDQRFIFVSESNLITTLTFSRSGSFTGDWSNGHPKQGDKSTVSWIGTTTQFSTLSELSNAVTQYETINVTVGDQVYGSLVASFDTETHNTTYNLTLMQDLSSPAQRVIGNFKRNWAIPTAGDLYVIERSLGSTRNNYVRIEKGGRATLMATEPIASGNYRKSFLV